MIDQDLVVISEFLFSNGPTDSSFHPIDRYFIEPFLDIILKFDKVDFICYNLDRGFYTYSNYLLLCLPELWEGIGYEDVVQMTEKLNEKPSNFHLVEFMMKYIEVDGLKIMLSNPNLSEDVLNSTASYVKRNYQNILKDETDYLFLSEKGVGVTNERWMDVKKKLLLTPGFEEAPKDLNSFEQYILKLG